MSATTSLDADAILGDLKIVDADCHLAEPPDLWTARAPASLKGRVPTMGDWNGLLVWYVDGRPWTGAQGGLAIGHNRTKVRGVLALPWDQIDPASWSVQDRLALMDEQGIYAEVLYPNSLGFGCNSFFGIEDVEFRNVVCGIYNDYLVEVQQESGDRLLPQAVLPVWDIDLTVRELQRLHEAGIRGFTVSDKPFVVGLPDLDEPYYEPMWRQADELGTVINFHIGSGMPAIGPETSRELLESPRPDLYWLSFGPQRRLATLGTQFYMSNVRIITNLCMSDFFDRYPNIKVVSAESGIGWVPFVLEAMEYQLDEMVTDPAERALQSRRPTEYFRSNVYVTTWFERSAWKVIDDVGVNNVMVMTDVPHPTCLYPRSREHFAEVSAHLDPGVRRRVLQDNAADVYRLTLR